MESSVQRVEKLIKTDALKAPLCKGGCQISPKG